MRYSFVGQLAARMLLARRTTATFLPITVVLCDGSQLQMFKVDATWVIASVAHNLTGWDRPVSLSEHQPMGTPLSAIHVLHTVP